MFTGIIERTGKIEKIERSAEGATFVIQGADSEMRIGESIAVNGTCVTVVKCSKDNFSVELSPETLEKTTFKRIAVGARVNLEKPLRLNDRLGGHLVSGHVDGVGQLIGKREEGNSVVMEFSIPPEFAKYLIAKGSVAIDGISLTVVEVHGNQFTVAVIPHTLEVTILQDKKIGEDVNLEFDLVAKYIERFAQFQPSKESISLEFLQSHGFA